MQSQSPHRPHTPGQANGGPKQHGGMNGNGMHQHHQQRPHSAGGGAHQQQQQNQPRKHQQHQGQQQNGGFQSRPPQYPNGQHHQKSPGDTHHHNAARLQAQSAVPQIRNVSVPTSQPKNAAASSSAPGTGRYVAFGGVASGEEQMDVDDVLSGNTVLQRTIGFKKSASSFSSSANFSGAKQMPPHFAQLQPKPQQQQQQQQNGNRPQQQQQQNGRPQQKTNIHPNGLPPQHKHQQKNGGPAMKSPQLHANQRSPGIKPFSTASLPRNAHGIPIVHDKDPNSFRWPKKYLYPSSTVQAMLQWQQFDKIGCGLSNMGNTCFLNAVLQALAYTPPLVNFLRKGEHSRNCRVAKKKAAGNDEGIFCLFCALEQTVKQMHAHRSHAIQPREIVSHLRSISRRFRLGRQEDSHEFLRMAMDMLQANDLRTYGGQKVITDLRVQETTALFGIFGGYLRSQVKCLVCNYRSNTYDAFLDLSLEVSEVSSVTKALHSFTRPEKLDAENLYRCARCQKKVRAEKHLSVFKAPTVLCIQLKRFQFQQSMGMGGFGGGGGGMGGSMGGSMFAMMMSGGGGGGGKITKPIQFNEKLSLEAHMSDRHSAPSYSLYAVLVHSGSTVHSGHYFSFVKSSSGQWHCMDDSSVRQVGLQAVLSQKAYMLFYVRDAIETLPVSAPSPGASPSLGPLQTPGSIAASAAAGAAAAEKVKALNDALLKKKLAALTEQKTSQPDRDGDSDEGDSDEGDHDEDSDSEDGSYRSDEPSEEEASSDEEEEEEKSEAESDEEEEADVSAEEDEDADVDMSDGASSASSSSSSTGFLLPPRILTSYRVRLHTMQALGLHPPQVGLPRYGFPNMRRREDAMEIDQEEAEEEEEEEEEEDAPREMTMSRKRKRQLLEEMAAEVADLSAEDEDEEVPSDSDDDEEDDESTRKRKLIVQEMMASMASLSGAEDEHEEMGGEEDEEIESDEEDAEIPLGKKFSSEEDNSAKSKKDSDKHDAKRAKKDPSSTSSASPSTATSKPAPQPFWFSAEAEVAAKSGKAQEPIQFRFDLSLTPKTTTNTPAAASTTASTATTASPTITSTTPTRAPTPGTPSASAPSSTVSKPRHSGPIILSRSAFDPRMLARDYKESQFGQPVGDWDSTVASLEATREKYAMKRAQDRANAALTPQQKEKDAWDEELDKGHVRKLKNRDALSAAGVHGETGANLFQTAQNARNRTRDAIRSGEQPEHASKDQKKKRGAVRGLAAKGHRSHKERNAERKAGGKKEGPKGLRDF